MPILLAKIIRFKMHDSAMSSLENRIFVCIMFDKWGAGLSAYTFPITNSRCGRGVMQMSVFLALVQTFVGAATLGVALLALTRENPPQDGGNSNSSED